MRSSQNIGRNRPRRKARDRILVVTEGIKTEVQYVQGLIQHLKSSGVDVKSADTKGIGRDPLSVLMEAERLRHEDGDGYDSTWVIVDVDEHTTLPECLREGKARDIQVVVSNPCFEVWLLWHFQDMTKFCTNGDLRRELRRHDHDGKSIGPRFPFADYVEAERRATAGKRAVSVGIKGSNPSSAMPDLLSRIR